MHAASTTSPIAASCSAGPAAIDLFRDLPLTGNFVLVSALDGATVAGGVITWAQAGAPAVGDNVLVLNRALLARGLCADLGDSPADLGRVQPAGAGGRGSATLGRRAGSDRALSRRNNIKDASAILASAMSIPASFSRCCAGRSPASWWARGWRGSRPWLLRPILAITLCYAAWALFNKG